MGALLDGESVGAPHWQSQWHPALQGEKKMESKVGIAHPS